MLSRQRPSPGTPPELTSTPYQASAPDDENLAITWIGHSTFLIESRGIRALTDPIWSNRASPVQFAGPHRYTPPAVPLAKLPPIDVVFISHDHYDHLDNATVRHLIDKFSGARWVAPLGVGRFLARRGATLITEMDWWETSDLGSLSVSCTPAQHFSGRLPWNRNSTLWCGWVIGIGAHRVFFAGDTALHSEFGEIARRFGALDAAILPIGAYEPRWFMQPVHMSPLDAVAAYQEIAGPGLSGKCLFIPSHWGTFRLTDEPLNEPPRLLRETWALSGLNEQHLCILAPGATVRR